MKEGGGVTMYLYELAWILPSIAIPVGMLAALLVTAPADVRRRRVEARGQDFDERSARQLPEDEKAARADRVLVNDAGLDDLRAWVAARFAEYAGRPCDAPIRDN